MQSHELVEILRRMHREGRANGEAKPMVILFGIKYAAEIEACGVSKDKLAKQAIPGSTKYGGEIGVGMKLARYVRPLAIAALAAFLLHAAPAPAHDISQDRSYENSRDPAHECHHLRVAYWNEMIEHAIEKVAHFRYQHARPPVADQEMAEIVQLHAQARVGAIEATDGLLATWDEEAQELGCTPWPG